MREKFLTADVAMTGANFAVASTGEIVVCTNEGNADMGDFVPKSPYCHVRNGEDRSRPGGAGCLYPSAGPFRYRATDYFLYFPLP